MKAATTIQVNFRVENAIKRRADIILNGIGISMSSALNMFLRQVVARQAIPMELRYDPLTDPARLEQAFSDYENGRKNYHFHELPPLPEDDAEVPMTKEPIAKPCQRGRAGTRVPTKSGKIGRVTRPA